MAESQRREEQAVYMISLKDFHQREVAECQIGKSGEQRQRSPTRGTTCFVTCGQPKRLNRQDRQSYTKRLGKFM